MAKNEKQSAPLVSDEQIEALSGVLGHVFAQPALLRHALTHPSLGVAKGAGKRAVYSPYERLEFLGDRVLGLVMAEALYKRFPDAKEGELAKRHAALVNRDALRIVAHALMLERYLRLAHGEVPEVAHKNMTVLSDATEAVIGALYLDAGLEVARAFIERNWKDMVTAPVKPPEDPKTALQEWAQGRGLPLPAYNVLERSGPAHAPQFVVEASVQGYKACVAEGPSKRLAEKSAACELLNALESETK